jgi:hypothetical protein
MTEGPMLRLPRADEEHEFLRAHRATSPEVPYFLHHYTEGMPFQPYLQYAGRTERTGMMRLGKSLSVTLCSGMDGLEAILRDPAFARADQ